MTQSTKNSQASGVDRLKRFVEGNILWLLCGAYVVAACWPSAGIAIRETTVGSQPLTLALLAALLFFAGLSIDSSDVTAAKRSGWLVLTGQAILWGTPLLGRGHPGTIQRLSDGQYTRWTWTCRVNACCRLIGRLVSVGQR